MNHDSAEELAAKLKSSIEYVEVSGRQGFVILPESPSTGPAPWVWYAPTFQNTFPRTENLWMLQQLFNAGMGAAGVDIGESYGSPAGRQVYSEFYSVVTEQFGFTDKAVLLPQSRGGLMLYNWAAENPKKVLCISGIFPVGDLRSYPGLEKAAPAYGMTSGELESALSDHNPVERLAPLAEAGVPIAHVHGDSDTVVPIERNSGALAERYCELGGRFDLIVISGGGHEVTPSFFQCQQLVDFVLEHVISR